MDFDCKLPMFRTWVVGIDLGRSGVQVEGYHPRPFGMRGGCTVPPWPRFPRPPDNPGRPNFSSNMFLRTYDAVKPAVRDDREGDGNGGIIRSPSRATALPGNPRPKLGMLVIDFKQRWNGGILAISSNLNWRRKTSHPRRFTRFQRANRRDGR